MAFSEVDLALMKTIRQHYNQGKPNDTEKMITFLRGLCSDKHNLKPNTLKALGYASRKHKFQNRKGGEAYINHPLWMANFAVGLGLTDDELLAIILLHDVPEDTNTSIDELPFNETIRRGVKYMTIAEFPGEDKAETKRRYFRSLLEDKNALICKAIDRIDNLSTMTGVFEPERIEKNVRETHELLMPVLEEAKEIYPEYANEITVLRGMLNIIYTNLAIVFGIDLFEENN